MSAIDWGTLFNGLSLAGICWLVKTVSDVSARVAVLEAISLERRSQLDDLIRRLGKLEDRRDARDVADAG